MVFTHQEPSRIESSRLRKHLRKSGPGTFKTMPGPSRNPPKTGSGARQDAQKPAKTDKKRSKTDKMQPRSTQERKMAPTGPQHASQNFG